MFTKFNMHRVVALREPNVNIEYNDTAKTLIIVFGTVYENSVPREGKNTTATDSQILLFVRGRSESIKLARIDQSDMQIVSPAMRPRLIDNGSIIDYQGTRVLTFRGRSPVNRSLASIPRGYVPINRLNRFAYFRF